MESMDRKIACLVVAQISFAVCMSIIVGIRVGDAVPHDWNATSWTRFSTLVSEELHVYGVLQQALLLLTLHMMHLFCYLPMLHVTKIMYGYWLGLAAGWTLCVLWELGLFVVFLQVLVREPRSAFQRYVAEVRRKKRLFFEITVVSVSSLPLQTKTLLVKFSNITNGEYLLANVAPTLLLSFKNVVCGALLAGNPTPRTMATLGLVIGVSLLLPTLSTIAVSSKTIFVALRAEQHRNACDSDSSEENASRDIQEPREIKNPQEPKKSQEPSKPKEPKKLNKCPEKGNRSVSMRICPMPTITEQDMVDPSEMHTHLLQGQTTKSEV